MNDTQPSNPLAPDAPAVRGTLAPGELHPAVVSALEYLDSLPVDRKILIQDFFDTGARDGGSFAAVCGETLRRVVSREPAGDRYVIALAWVISTMGADKLAGV